MTCCPQMKSWVGWWSDNAAGLAQGLGPFACICISHICMYCLVHRRAAVARVDRPRVERRQLGARVAVPRGERAGRGGRARGARLGVVCEGGHGLACLVLLRRLHPAHPACRRVAARRGRRGDARRIERQPHLVRVGVGVRLGLGLALALGFGLGLGLGLGLESGSGLASGPGLGSGGKCGRRTAIRSGPAA